MVAVNEFRYYWVFALLTKVVRSVFDRYDELSSLGRFFVFTWFEPCAICVVWILGVIGVGKDRKSAV